MKGLKGALINNFYLLRTRSMASYLLITVAAFVAYLVSREEIFLFFAQIFFVATIPWGVMETSEVSFISRWNSFEKAFGISPVLLIITRYIMFIVISLVCAGIWQLFAPAQEMEAFVDMEFLLLWVHLGAAAYFPIMYALNPNKKNSSAVIFLVAVGVSLALVSLIMARIEAVALQVAVIAGMYVISAALSVMFDKFHRGRAA